MSVQYDHSRGRFVVRWREDGKQRGRRFATEIEAREFDAHVNPRGRTLPTNGRAQAARTSNPRVARPCSPRAASGNSPTARTSARHRVRRYVVIVGDAMRSGSLRASAPALPASALWRVSVPPGRRSRAPRCTTGWRPGSSTARLRSWSRGPPTTTPCAPRSPRTRGRGGSSDGAMPRRSPRSPARSGRSGRRRCQGRRRP
jgi:hypothetical protein